MRAPRLPPLLAPAGRSIVLAGAGRTLSFTHPQQAAAAMAEFPGAIPSPRQRSDAAPARLTRRGALPLVSEVNLARLASARSQIQKPADPGSRR
jgi:hypothetical protein